ncbi:MAG TPA: histidinol dehydrogenase, partial [bacterium]|nr:histidinol dehydrogenase [bacterium]
KIIAKAIEKITKYHKNQQIPIFTINEDGLKIKFRTKPVEKAGIYIPAGSAPLVSTTLMTAIPAKIAGVKEIIACSPPIYKGSIHPYITGCLSMLGIKNIFKVGGSQAIAAMAFGTETIPKVNIIVGPGNVYVNAAKKLLIGNVGIDLLAGPSELVVLADNTANIDFITADLNAQAEHRYSTIFLLCTEDTIGKKISKKINDGYWIKISSINEGVNIINHIAPEHLQIICKNAKTVAEKCVAGAIFIGNHTPCAIGDYIAGPSHTLPTGGSACFNSGLNVFTFLRTYAIMEANKHFVKKNGIIAERIAEIENLFKHRDSIKIRRLTK